MMVEVLVLFRTVVCLCVRADGLVSTVVILLHVFLQNYTGFVHKIYE